MRLSRRTAVLIRVDSSHSWFNCFSVNTIKLSAPVTKEFWEIPVLFEDDHLLALDKPASCPSSFRATPKLLCAST
jgi:23S rRNA-/tRNA-specific pseudouridylate synthase